MDNGLLAGVKTSGKLPHIVTALLLPPLILVVCSLIGGMIYDVVLPEGLAGSSLAIAFVAQNLDYVLPFGLMICALSAWVLLREKRPLSTLGFKRGGAPVKYVIGMASGIALYLVCMAFSIATGAVDLRPTMEIGPLTSALVLFGLAGFVVQGAAEEILYRGWQLPVIAARYGALAAVVLSTVTFTLIHLIAGLDNLYYYLVIFVFAVFLSLVALYTESLWVTCGLHATWNWADTNLFSTPVKDAAFNTSFYGYTINGTGDLYAFVQIGVLVVAILLLVALFVLKARKVGKSAPDTIAAKGSV